MSSMNEKFSVCLWMRVLLSTGNGVPFAYSKYEIFLRQDGRYNLLFDTNLSYDLRSKFTAPRGTWFAYCGTWSLLSRTHKIYVDGKLVGSQEKASDRRLETGHTMVLGDYLTGGSSHSFRGEMFNLNFFSKELTATEVASLSSRGLCTDIPEQLQDYRVIKWEEILQLSRTGNVSDIDTCVPAELQSRLKQMENEAGIIQGKLDVAVAEKSGLEASLNKTQSELVNVQDRFNSTQQELFKVQGLFNSSQDELVKIQGLFNTSEEELVKVKDSWRLKDSWKPPKNS